MEEKDKHQVLTSSSCSKPTTPTEIQKHEDQKLSELLTNGKWGALITLMCYFYGNMTIAVRMPKDPRQATWTTTKTPLPTLVSSLGYVALVTWLGPKLMRNKDPFRGLRIPMMVYNALQVAFNSYLFYQACKHGWLTSYKLFCEPCNFSTTDPSAIGMMYAAYWYYISKIVDFIDTIFFVVHKKYDHISLLHVCHHALMPVSTWFGLVYHPGGHTTFMGFLNTFVHVVMYSYYLLAAMGPRVRPYLWWKRYITTIQMAQFIAMFLHSMSTLLFLDCNVPSEFAQWIGGFALVFQILFTDFYIKAYRKKASTTFQMCKLDNDVLKSTAPLKGSYSVQEGHLYPSCSAQKGHHLSTGCSATGHPSPSSNPGPHTGAISKCSSGGTTDIKTGDLFPGALRNRNNEATKTQ